MPLSDDLIVYPNHGAGSACGKKMSAETTDTLGNQKRTNYALRPDMTKEEFIAELLTGLTAPPSYFPQNVLMNIGGYDSLETIMERGHRGLGALEFEELANQTSAVVLDTRNATEFSKGFIPKSVNIGIDGNFAQWVGEMIPDVKQKILLVTVPGREEEVITRLSRVGYDFTIGYLKGGFNTWHDAGKEMETFNRIAPSELEAMVEKSSDVLLIDVRKKSEYDSEHVLNSINIPLNQLNMNLDKFPKDKAFVVFCAGGYRSMIASSILKQRGWHNFTDVVGGFAEISKTKIPVSAYVCPSTLL
jgi:hydroxyacylglutathione hydrolase